MEQISASSLRLIRRLVPELSGATRPVILENINTRKTSKELAQAFMEVRWQFGLINLKCSYMRNEEFLKAIGGYMQTVAAVGSGEVMINLDYLDALRVEKGEAAVFLAILDIQVHECGHPYLAYRAPGTFRNKLDDAAKVKKRLGDKQVMATMYLLNLVYDTILETFSYDRGIFGGGKYVLDAFDAFEKSQKPADAEEAVEPERRSYVGQFLISYREVLMKTDLGICDIEPPVRECAEKVVAEIRATEMDQIHIALAIPRIAEWLTELFTSDPGPPDPSEGEDDDPKDKGEEGEGEGDNKEAGDSEGDGSESEGSEDSDADKGSTPKKKKKSKRKPKKPKKGKPGDLTVEELQKLLEALEKALVEVGADGDSSTAEDLEDDPLAAKLAKVNLEDMEEMNLAAQILEMNPDEAAFEFLWAMAAEKVKIQPPLGNIGEGSTYTAGMVPWMMGMPVKDVDFRATLETSGRFIPGVTTLQPYQVAGQGTPQEGTSPRIAGCIDVSGSMYQVSPVRDEYNRDTVLMTAFAIIHDAKRRKVPTAWNIFADTNYLIPWSTAYKKVARELFDNIHSAGGGNSCTGLEQISSILLPADFLIYATDYYLCGYEAKGAVELRQLQQRGVNICMIAMFDHCAQKAGIPFIECKELDDLNKVALKAIPKP